MERSSGEGATPAKWADESLRRFYFAFHKHGTDFGKVSKSVGSFKTAGQCESLYRQFQNFLGLPSELQLETAFVAMVTDHNKNLAGRDSEVCTDATVSNDEAPPENGARDKGDVSNDERAARTPQKAEEKEDTAYATPNLPPLVSPMPCHSSQKKRARRLFSGDECEGPDMPPQTCRHDLLDRWRERNNDEIGEGVDALLSLASISHASPVAAAGPDLAASHPTPGSKRNSHVALEGACSDIGSAGDRNGGDCDEMNSGKLRSRASVSGARQLREIMLSSPTSRGRTSRLPTQTSKSTPPAGVKSPIRYSARANSRGQAEELVQSPMASVGKASRRSSRRALQRRHFEESDEQSTEECGGDEEPLGHGGMLGKRTPMLAQPDLEDIHAVTSAGKRGGRNGHLHAGSLAEHLTPHGMVMMSEGLDLYGYDPALFSSTLNLLPFQMEVFNRPLAVMPPLTARLTNQLVRSLGPVGGRECSPDPGDLLLHPLLMQPEGRSRRRKPLPEKFSSSLYTHKTSSGMHQRSQQASGFLPGGGLSTPTSAAVAAAAASVLSPTGLGMGSPSFLPGASGLGGLGRLNGCGNAGYLGGKSGSTPAPPPLGETGEPQSFPEITLRHALSMRCRRWCLYEFLYSAIDRPWFIRNEVAAMLQELAGGHQAPVPARLTRGEWALLRGGFGQARRLSLSFLKEERIKLEAYREHVRRIYDDLSPRSTMEVPPDLPRPLVVGQDVAARHPITRQLHDGVILTVKGNKYRVQFNRSELMTQEVADVDLMPQDPHLNLPLAVASRPVLLNGRTALSCNADRGAQAARRRNLPAHRFPSAMMQAGSAGRMIMQHALKGGETMSEAERACITEINQILSTKEVLVARLKEMNDDSSAGAYKDANGNHTDNFQLIYTQVILQLKELNSQLESRLLRIGSGNAQFSSLAATALMGGDGGQLNNIGAHGSGSPLADVPPGSAVAGKGPSEAGGSAGHFIKSEFHHNPAAGAAHGLVSRTLEGSYQNAGGPTGRDLVTVSRTTRALPLSAAAIGASADHAAAADDASTLLLSAIVDAGAVVATCRPKAQAVAAVAAAAAAAASGAGSAAAATELSPAGSGAGEGEAMLQDLVTGAVGLLLTLQKCTLVEPLLPISTVEQAIEKALQLVRPKHAANTDLFKEVESSVKALQELLTR